MKLPPLPKTIDLDSTKEYFKNKIKADHSKVGKGFRLLGIVASVVSVLETILHKPIYVGSANLNAVVLGAGIAFFFYSFLTESKNFKKVVHFNNTQLQKRLDYYLGKLKDGVGADGAFLCKYHNGDSFGTIPSARFTMIRAVSNSGVNDDIKDFYNQDMSIYAVAYDQMNKQKFAVVDMKNATSEMRYLMDKQGVKKMVLIPIKKPLSDLNEGMVGVRYLNDNPDIEHKKVDWLVDEGKKATGILQDVEVDIVK